MRSRIAEVTATFWAVTILVAGVGEALSDLLARAVDPTIVAAGAAAAAVGTVVAQVTSRRYRGWLYWTTVAVVAVAATTAADTLHVLLGAGYVVTTVAFGCVTAVTLAMWYLAEATVDVRSTTTRTGQTFCWIATASTFALGTAACDLTAGALGLGPVAAGVVFALLGVAVAVAHRWLELPAVPAFWAGYVLARPLGVALADAATGSAPVVAGVSAALLGVVVVWRRRPGRGGGARPRPSPARPAPATHVDEVWIG